MEFPIAKRLRLKTNSDYCLFLAAQQTAAAQNEHGRLGFAELAVVAAVSRAVFQPRYRLALRAPQNRAADSRDAQASPGQKAGRAILDHNGKRRVVWRL